MTLLTYLHADWVEIAGFVTGAASVWLTVRQRVSNWPVGIANSAFWMVLFFNSKLYLDSGLQVIYIGLGFAGWFWWWRGPQRRGLDVDNLPVVRTDRKTAWVLAAVTAVATAGLWAAQAWTNDAAPFWDASTTVVSLVATYMLTRKLFGNWWLWLAVDVVYVGLYSAEHLWLTAALQPAFMIMCVMGLRQWWASMSTTRPSLEVAA